MNFIVKMNPDESVVKNVLDSLVKNDGYCPCRLEKTPETKCMCKEFKDQEVTGLCHCGLYYKVPDYKFVATDFDGTIVEDKFPSIGEPNYLLIDKLRLIHEAGVKIILHTCREDGEIDSNGNVRNYLSEAVEFCKSINLPIDAVNENPWIPYGERKMYADIYIDDRAVNVKDVERL